MAVPFKKVMRKDPRNLTVNGKYYPQLVTQGNSVDLEYIADLMQRSSSLSVGDIKSVLANFVEAMRLALYSGQSVNIRDFGVFRLTASAEGTETKEDCTVKNIKAVNIRFRPSAGIKPSLIGTRGADRIKFYDVETGETSESDTNPGGGNKGGGGGGVIDPDA